MQSAHQAPKSLQWTFLGARHSSSNTSSKALGSAVQCSREDQLRALVGRPAMGRGGLLSLRIPCGSMQRLRPTQIGTEDAAELPFL